MGYKSVITTWKKIQDWVLELLEGLGLGTAYKYDKASDTATVKAGTIKNESGSFVWINSLGQWIINLGTNIAETWGILGNYRFGQDDNGNGTWNGIFQKDTQGNNFEVLHSDENITQLAHNGENMVILTRQEAQVKPPTGNPYSTHGLTVKGNVALLGFNMGSDSTAHGFAAYFNENYPRYDTLMLKLAGKAIVEAIKGSTAIGNEYNGTLYRVIRSGRDIMDKAFYTEFLMNNRAFLQIGSGDLSDGMPTPPGEESGINNTNSYLRLFYPNGKQLLFYGPGNQHGIALYYPTGTKAIDIEPESNNNLGVSDFGGGMVLRYRDGSAAIAIKNGRGYGSGTRSIIMEGLAASINTDSVSIGSTLTTGSVYIKTKNTNTNMIIWLESPRIVFVSGLQEGIKADYKQVTTIGSVKKAFKTYYYEYSGTYDAANPQFAVYKSQMGFPFTTLDIAGRCRHMHATIKFTNSNNNLNIFNLCDKCYISNDSGDVWVNLSGLINITDGTAYTIFFQFEIEES